LNAFFWWMVGLISAGVLLGAAGVIVQIVAWVRALINMFALLDRRGSWSSWPEPCWASSAS
jgi:hypothetical protein